jgi:predicted SPOUT superfamily RNA methylase MTH1
MKDAESRSNRKEEGRLKKRQRIEESGGIRPRHDKIEKQETNASSSRSNETSRNEDEAHAEKKMAAAEKIVASSNPTKQFSDEARKERNTPVGEKRPFSSSSSFTNRPKQPSGHRFGRVMEIVPCRNTPRFSTLSIALPGSVLSNCQTRELRTLLVGQIARAATIYHVDEIIVFDDKLSKNESKDNFNWSRQRRDERSNRASSYGPASAPSNDIAIAPSNNDTNDNEAAAAAAAAAEPAPERRQRSDPQTFMARLLQYCECPQYLRRHFFPMHPDLQFAGLLAPVDAPHHVRAEDRSKYREGVVLEKKSPRPDGGSLVNCGIRSRPVEYV